MKSPKIEDPTNAAKQQGVDNMEMAKFNAANNRPDTYTVFGNQRWARDPENPDRWILREELSPTEQAKYDKASGIELGALDSLTRAMPKIDEAINSPYKLEGSARTQLDPRYFANGGKLQGEVDLAGAPGMPKADFRTRMMVTEAMQRMGKKPLDQRFGDQSKEIENTLTNQGITRGTEAWDREQKALEDAKTAAYGDLTDRSILSGGQEMERDFGMGMSRRQQGVDERFRQGEFKNAATGQGYNIANMAAALENSGRAQNWEEMAQGKLLPINVMSALLTQGQVNAPKFQPYNNNISADPAPTYAANQQKNQNSINSANARNALIGSLASGAMGMFKFSDARLKSHVREIGVLPSGLPFYDYTIGGKQEEGVMAQDVEKVYPDLVVEDAQGWKLVNYGGLYAREYPQ